MRSTRQGQDLPPIIAGFVEGMFMPVLELLIGVFFRASLQASQVSGTGTSYLVEGFAAIVMVDFGRNVLIGLSRSQFAIGNIAGDLVGLLLFYRAFSLAFPDANAYSLVMTGALVASFAVSVFLALRSSRESQPAYGEWAPSY